MPSGSASAQAAVTTLASAIEMALRWAAPGMLAAQLQFWRVRGFGGLPVLAAALRREVGLPEREEVAVA